MGSQGTYNQFNGRHWHDPFASFSWVQKLTCQPHNIAHLASMHEMESSRKKEKPAAYIPLGQNLLIPWSCFQMTRAPVLLMTATGEG
eukprot:1067266-Pelagomonas_calceolata.AAC.1